MSRIVIVPLILIMAGAWWAWPKASSVASSMEGISTDAPERNHDRQEPGQEDALIRVTQDGLPESLAAKPLEDLLEDIRVNFLGLYQAHQQEIRDGWLSGEEHLLEQRIASGKESPIERALAHHDFSWVPLIRKEEYESLSLREMFIAEELLSQQADSRQRLSDSDEQALRKYPLDAIDRNPLSIPPDLLVTMLSGHRLDGHEGDALRRLGDCRDRAILETSRLQHRLNMDREISGTIVHDYLGAVHGEAITKPVRDLVDELLNHATISSDLENIAKRYLNQVREEALLAFPDSDIR